MANVIPIASGNVDSLSWRSNDTLTINNGYVLTINTDQTKFWNSVVINNGTLRIENTSTSTAVRFLMGRQSGVSAPSITPASGLGSIEIAGNWIEIGTGDGTSGQTLTVPYTDHVPAIWVETAASSGVYKPWANCVFKFPIQGGFSDIEGLTGFGSGPKGNVFYQEPKLTPTYHSVQTNCTTSTASRNLIVTSTAGIYPGAWLHGSVGITANSVVERVVDATTLEMNVVGSANSSAATVTIYNTNNCWLTDQITFGDGVNGNVLPNGAKVRVPNIMITGVYGINIGSSGTGANINLTNGGALTADKCLFSNSHNTFVSSQTLSLQNCGFSFNHNITKAYGVVMNSVCFSVWSQYPYLTGNRFQYGYAPRIEGGLTGIFNFQYITGSFTELVLYGSNCASSATAINNGYLVFAYADGITVDDVTVVLASSYANASTTADIVVNYVFRSLFRNLQVHGNGLLALYASSGNTFEDMNWSTSARQDNCLPNYASNISNFMGFDQSNDFVDGTPYYFKVRAKSTLLASEAWTQSKEYTIVPFYSSNLGFFNDVGFTPGNNSVVVVWDDRRPTHTAPAFEIYRSTAAGVPVRDAGTRIFTTNTVTTLTYTDSTVVNGTRYYYVLRKYYSAGVYEDTPVWDVTPSATATIGNYLTQGLWYNDASWVKSNVTVGTSSDTPSVCTAPLYTYPTTRRIQVTGANGTLTKTVSGLTIAQQYTASVWTYFSGSANNALAPVTSTPMRLTFGTAFLDFSATQSWVRTSVTFTATATSHDFIIRFNTSGNWVDLGNAQVNLGGSATLDMHTGATALASADWEPTKAHAVQCGWGSDHNTGGYLQSPKLTTLANVYSIHCSTTRGFTPDYFNEIGRSDNQTNIIRLTNSSSGNRFSRLTQQGKGAFIAQASVSLSASCNDNIFEDFLLDRGQSGYSNTAGASSVVSIGTDSNRNIFRDFDVRNNIPNQVATRPFHTANDSSGTVVSNFRVEPTNAYLNVQNNGMILKGCGGGNAYLQDAATTWAISSSSPDSVPSTFTGIYDTHFAEVYHSVTTGALHLFFTASTAASPPYVLTGSARFSNTGLLYLQAEGDSITYTWPHKILGVSGFRDMPHKVLQSDLGASTDILSSVLLEFQIDTGGGYSAWAEATPPNLNTLTLSASTGFYLKLRLTARKLIKYGARTNDFVVGETIRQLTSGATARVVADYQLGASGTLVVDTITGTWTLSTTLDIVRDSDSQPRCGDTNLTNGFMFGPGFTSYISGLQIHTTVDQTVMYPTDPITLTLTGLPSGCDVVVLSAGTDTVLTSVDAQAGTTFEYIYYAAHSVDIGIIKPGYVLFYFRNLALGTTNNSIPVTLSPDRNYL